MNPIGRVAATSQKPNTADSFYFWTNAGDVVVGIGSIVRVADDSGRRVYGVVVEGESYTDLQSPLHDFLGAEGNPLSQAPTDRPEIRCYRASVLRSLPEDRPMQPVPMGAVYLADDAGLEEALMMESYAKTRGIPVGVYESGAFQSPVYLDEHFLLGPESGHLNITGISGLATKTSAVEFLMASIFAHAKRDVAVICFNVKGTDLLYLDQPPLEPLSPKEEAMYAKLNIPLAPFDRVRYYAPFKADGFNLNTLRTHEDLVHNVFPLQWGARDVLDYVHVLLNRDDIDAKADALIDFIKERILDQPFNPDLEITETVTDFGTLNRWFARVIQTIEEAERSGGNWRTHNIATIRKVYNRLINLPTRCGGLLSDQGPTYDVDWQALTDRTVTVIDVAHMEPIGQELVFTRIVDELRKRLERGSLPVGRVVVFFDELNKYAPADGGDTFLKRTLLDISERGRYLGLVLFSAQQFRSQVHKRIVGNSGTNVLGRMDSDELAQPGYATLSAAIKTKLATLTKGQLLVRHPHFAQPIFVSFPRPFVMRGQDGKEWFAPSPDLGFEDCMVRAFKRLKPDLTARQVKDALHGYSPDEVLRVLHLLNQQPPDDPLKAFLRLATKAPARETVEKPGPVLEFGEL